MMGRRAAEPLPCLGPQSRDHMWLCNAAVWGSPKRRGDVATYALPHWVLKGGRSWMAYIKGVQA